MAREIFSTCSVISGVFGDYYSELMRFGITVSVTSFMPVR